MRRLVGHTIPGILLKRALAVSDVSISGVHDVMMRRESLLVGLSVEEPQGVPRTSNFLQTRGGEAERVAGHFVQRHLPSEGDVVEDHIPQSVSRAVRIQCRVVMRIRCRRVAYISPTRPSTLASSREAFRISGIDSARRTRSSKTSKMPSIVYRRCQRFAPP